MQPEAAKGTAPMRVRRVLVCGESSSRERASSRRAGRLPPFPSLSLSLSPPPLSLRVFPGSVLLCARPKRKQPSTHSTLPAHIQHTFSTLPSHFPHTPSTYHSTHQCTKHTSSTHPSHMAAHICAFAQAEAALCCAFAHAEGEMEGCQSIVYRGSIFYGGSNRPSKEEQ
jgi:hypothetical protein